jgi:hypothetical protein
MGIEICKGEKNRKGKTGAKEEDPPEDLIGVESTARLSYSSLHPMHFGKTVGNGFGVRFGVRIERKKKEGE